MNVRFLMFALIAWPTFVLAMLPLADEELSDITGQALLVSDYIPPSGAAGSDTDFGFFRLGLDAEVLVNMNIDRLQLGCGGFNEVIRPASCDIDLEFVSFMGLNATQDGPAGNRGTSAAERKAAVDSDMLLMRPYLELAIRNPGSANNREIAGFKVGSESVTGFMGVGCAPSSPGCGATHRGITNFSGYINAFMNGITRFTTGLGNGTACIGNMPSNPNCGGPEFYNYGGGVPSRVDGNDFSGITANRTSTAFAGTRFNEIYARGVRLNNVYGGSGLIGLLDPDEMYVTLRLRMNEVHGFILNDTEDFGLSFQREQVAYPKYDKTGYSYPASQGWWMNVPSVFLKDIDTATVDLGCPGLICLGLLDSFSAPGINIDYPDLRDTPPVNCYGTARFC